MTRGLVFFPYRTPLQRVSRIPMMASTAADKGKPLQLWGLLLLATIMGN